MERVENFVREAVTGLIDDPYLALGLWLAVAVCAIAGNFYKWHINGRKLSPDVPPWVSIAYLCYDGMVTTPLELVALVGTMTYLGLRACEGNWDGWFTFASSWAVALFIFERGLRQGRIWKRYLPIVREGLEKDPAKVILSAVGNFLLLPGMVVQMYAHELGLWGFQWLLGLRVAWRLLIYGEVSREKQR